MSNYLPDDSWFEALAAEQDEAIPARRAPSRLKARVYSSLIRHQQASGRLESLPETKKAGQGLCVFEELVRITPVGEQAQSFNCCSVCHARVMAEKIENAPIYWGHCPYVRFQNR